jgi:hypothetical protein
VRLDADGVEHPGPVGKVAEPDLLKAHYRALSYSVADPVLQRGYRELAKETE